MPRARSMGRETFSAHSETGAVITAVCILNPIGRHLSSREGKVPSEAHFVGISVRRLDADAEITIRYLSPMTPPNSKGRACHNPRTMEATRATTCFSFADRSSVPA